VSDARVAREGLEGVRPGREASSDYSTRRPRKGGRRGGRGEQPTVPDADFRSYYGKPVLNKPVWSPQDIAGYLFLGGLAGGSSLLAAAAAVRGEERLARVAKVGAASAGVLSLAALVHDLGKPTRFLHMLRVVKVTSPMNMGSWLLAGYVPTTLVAAACEVTGRLRPVGAAATAGAAVMGPAVASYTAVLIADTAVPAWHDGYREMPFVFVGSGAMAAGGLGLLGSSQRAQGLPRRVAQLGSLAELGSSMLMERRMGMVAEPYKKGRSGALMRVGQVLAVAGNVTALLGRGNRAAGVAAGTTLMLSSAITRFGIFSAGIASAQDPRYTVQPQRERLTDAGRGARADAG
jgi:polysulfide reductase-like protein